MAGKGRQMARKPATKFAHLRKKMTNPERCQRFAGKSELRGRWPGRNQDRGTAGVCRSDWPFRQHDQ